MDYFFLKIHSGLLNEIRDRPVGLVPFYFSTTQLSTVFTESLRLDCRPGIDQMGSCNNMLHCCYVLYRDLQRVIDPQPGSFQQLNFANTALGYNRFDAGGFK